jgi:3-oxoacid CoA-transferase subunit A
VLVQPLEEQEVKKGGIIIPDTAKEKPQEGKVVALGTGKIDDNGKKVDFTVKKGDKVLISKYGGTEIKIDGETYLMEKGLVADVALVHAWKGDTEGNLVYRKTARNFNPMMATAGKVTIAEVEHLVEPGQIDPDAIHTPGIFVQRIVHYPAYEKRIEQRTVRKRAA